MNFPEKLFSLRKSKNLSQKKLAQEIGVSQASINYWEKGQRNPSISAAIDIANYFGIELSELLTPDIYESESTTLIGHNVKILREEKGYSIPELSKLTGIPETIIEQYENGLRTPKNKNLISLAAVLDPVGSRLLGEELPFVLYVPREENPSGYKIIDDGFTINHIHDDFTIRGSEFEIINNFRELNEIGQEEAKKRVAELTEITRYIKVRRDTGSGTSD